MQCVQCIIILYKLRAVQHLYCGRRVVVVVGEGGRTVASLLLLRVFYLTDFSGLIIHVDIC